MNLQNLFTLSISILFYIDGGKTQGLPDQIQEFLQKSVLNPIKETVKEGAQELVGILKKISDIETETVNATNTNLTSNTSNTRDNISGLEYIQQVVEKLSPTELPASLESEITTSNYIPEEDGTASPICNNRSNKASKDSSSTTSSLTSEDINKLKTLCPELSTLEDAALNPWRYYEPTEKCFRFGRQGPCGNGMILYVKDSESIFGVCECKLGKRIQIFSNVSNACYEIFKQGDCPESQWIDLTRDGDRTCQPNPCLTPGKDMVKLNGSCVEVNQKSDKCKENEIVAFVSIISPKNSTFIRNAACTVPRYGNIQAGSVPCPPGSSLAIHGKCHVSQWDFGDDEKDS